MNNKIRGIPFEDWCPVGYIPSRVKTQEDGRAICPLCKRSVKVRKVRAGGGYARYFYDHRKPKD